MARSQKQLEFAITDIKRQIEEVQKLKVVAKFSGNEQVLALFNERKDFHDKAIHSFNPADPNLAMGYAVHKACMGLMDHFIDGMTTAESKIDSLKTQFLALNEELGKVLDEQKEREKRAM